jgi:hypothetical protein
MRGKPDNPFLVEGYHGPTYFCDREAETNALASALSNGRNVALISPRRMGKTGLILHTFHKLRKADKDNRCFYLDIFHTQNLAEFVAALGKIVLGRLDDSPEGMFRHVAGFFKALRPSLTFDAGTGAPSISLDVSPAQAQNGLDEIFDYLVRSGRRCHIAIDEFQQILEYPEKGVEALLRSRAQFAQDIRFVFSGSKKHLMTEMFASAKRPFYQSSQKMFLKEIAPGAYRAFAVRHFAADGRTLPPEVFDRVYATLSAHTWYVQCVLNQMYARRGAAPTVALADEILGGILREESAVYKTYCDNLAKGQLRMLKAVAAEGRFSGTVDAAFLRRHTLNAASSARLALKALESKSLLIRDDGGGYNVYDRFFGLWLARQMQSVPEESA